jgi:hypothetical protein
MVSVNIQPYRLGSPTYCRLVANGKALKSINYCTPTDNFKVENRILTVFISVLLFTGLFSNSFLGGSNSSKASSQAFQHPAVSFE